MPLEDIWSNPLLKQIQVELHAQEHYQVPFDCRQGGGLHNLSRQLAPVLHDMNSKEVLHDVQQELSVFQFMHSASYPVTGHQ